MSNDRAFIFANGEHADLRVVREQIRPGDRLIAADNGLQYLRLLGLRPDLLIGDLDSVSPEEKAALQLDAASIEQHPPQKNETDLELAVLAALRQGARFIRIVAALGGRLDMTLANIFLLALPELAGVDIRLDDGLEEVFLICPGAPGEIHGQVGEIVSLLPLSGPADGIRTSGLEYPLRGETLYPERTRGISNRLAAEAARVTLEAGQLICIHTRQPGR